MAAARVFITAAEASADRHAGELVRRLKELRPGVVIEGIGGPRMGEAGVLIHRETTERAAMSWRAALRAREVAGWIALARKRFEEEKFDLQICCDSWSMNWHFAKLAKERGVPVLYYIAPQTWASREGRIARLKKYVDELACILPFEEGYFRQNGVKATFVGHPLFDELPEGVEAKKEGREFGDGPVIGLLPGSRASIARANFPHQLEVARRVREVFPRARFLVPTTDVTHGTVIRMIEPGDWVQVKRDGFDEMVRQCDFCVTVSGTAALHVAAHGVPMVVVYRGNPVLWHLIGRWVIKARTYSLVNILSGEEKHVAPEFIPWYGSDAGVAECVIDYLRHPAKMEEQRGKLARVVGKLNQRGASRRVAAMAERMINAGRVGSSQ